MTKQIYASLFFLFSCGILSAATFTSNVASGFWNTPGSWTVTGADADSIPDSNDNVTIASGNSITLNAASICRNLTVDGGATLTYNNKALLCYGSFTRTGTTLGSGGIYFFGNPGTITITGTYNNGGNWSFQANSNMTIAAGSSIVKPNYFTLQNGSTLTNLGSVFLSSGSVTVATTGNFINGATGTIAVARPFTGTTANFDFTAVGNRVRYYGSMVTTILQTTYHHLDVINNGTITWTGGALDVNGSFRIFAGSTVDCANQNMTIGENWFNFASSNCLNMATVTFDGASAQIQRSSGTEKFKNLILSTSGTVTASKPINCTGNFSITSGTFDVTTSNNALAVKGNFTDNGTFMGRNGTVTLNGTSAQVIDGASTTSFYNLTTSNAAGVTVNTAKIISNILTVSAGSFGPSAAGSLTLLATGPTTSARIAPLGATGSLTGTTWIIQTYINGPATAYWQYLTPPTSGTTVADWDGDTRFYMSGVGGNEGTACCPTFYSVRTYNTATNTYSNVTSTGTALNPARGYMVWMGDNMTQLTAPLIFDTRGTPNFNTVNRAVASGGSGAGYNLVGNPYACPVTFANVVAASSASLSANFLILQENGSYATNPNGGTIAAAQGFMCVANTSGNITFTESCKSTTANPNVMREVAGNRIRIKVGNDVNGLGEETTVQLDPSGNESYDMWTDLPYLPSPYENATHIWTQNANGDQFILNNIGTGEDHLMIPVNVITSTPGMQTLTFKDLNTVTEYNCAWLEDLTTGQHISLNGVDTYSFDEPELGATRNFILHLERTNNCSFDLTTTGPSLDAQTNVFVSGGQVFAGFEFATEEPVTISMYDLNGKMIMGETSMLVSTESITLPNPDAHGIYLVRIMKGSEVVTKKFYY